jgi:hypothetical protein
MRTDSESESSLSLSNLMLPPAQRIKWLLWLVGNELFPTFYQGLQFSASFGETVVNSCHLCIYAYAAGVGSGLRALAS